MKKTVLMACLTFILSTAVACAQMDRWHMMGEGMPHGEKSEDGNGYGNPPYPKGMSQGMMNQGAYGMDRCMMHEGMTGYGMGGRMSDHMGGYGMGQGMMGQMGGYGMTGAGGEAYQKFMDETADLRKKLHMRKFDYHEALRKPESANESLLKLEREMYELQWDIYEKSRR